MAQTEWSGEHLSVRRYEPGEQIEDPTPGDFALTHGKAWTSWLIRFGQGLRYRGPDRKYTHWSHTALFVDRAGDMVEALGNGVAQTHISRYLPTEYTVVRIDASPADREQVVAFARDCLNRPYGYLTLASIALSLLTGGKLIFGIAGSKICSGLVARALERTGTIYAFEPLQAMPADLAKAYRAEPPPAGTPRGDIPGGFKGLPRRAAGDQGRPRAAG